MSTIHSPGPWRVGTVDLIPGVPLVMAVLDNAGETVATINEEDQEAAPHNARLIAAAPKLLAVVRRLIAEDDAGEYTVGLIEDARAAVAEATGDTR